MKAEEFVVNRYPKAIVEHYHTNNPFDKKGYWLCFSEINGDRLGEGKSASGAWGNAKKEIIHWENEK